MDFYTLMIIYLISNNVHNILPSYQSPSSVLWHTGRSFSASFSTAFLSKSTREVNLQCAAPQFLTVFLYVFHPNVPKEIILGLSLHAHCASCASTMSWSRCIFFSAYDLFTRYFLCRNTSSRLDIASVYSHVYYRFSFEGQEVNRKVKCFKSSNFALFRE